MRIAFAGNPNSGKTTTYNVLTGRKEKVGNWAGVTVGKKEYPVLKAFAGDRDIVAIDLPGAYSMSPFTPEESITSNFIRSEHPDVIINVVDATNLSRSLFFTSQLLELGIPVVVALNKSDLNRKEGTSIDADRLSFLLGCPMLETASADEKDKGLEELAKEAIKVEGIAQKAPYIQEQFDNRDRMAVNAADRKRFEFVNSIVIQVETRKSSASEITLQDKIDVVVTNRLAGLPIFAIVMWAVFAISQSYLGPFIADWMTGYMLSLQNFVSSMMENSPAILSALLADGIVGGVGAVLGFLPLVMIMYFLLALLEDCGYMARVSVLLNPIFQKVGLNGKSIIPIIIGTGCGIPGIMACRTIRDERERRATAMLTTFIPCGAKIPVIALFAGAFFAGASWVSVASYFLGILLIVMGAVLVKAVTGNKYDRSFFVMELPKYKIPSIKKAFWSVMERAKAYIIKAATIILVCNCAIQIMQNFNWKLQMVGDGAADTSILAGIASPFAILLIPLGFGAWQFAAASICGFIAKENVVGTLAVVFSLTTFINTDELSMTGGAGTVAATMGLTSVTALAYLFFNLYTPPCFAAMGAMRSELTSRGWFWCAIGLQTGMGYTIAFIVNQVGNLITTGMPAAGFVPGLSAIVAMTFATVIISRKIRASFDAQYAVHNDAKANAALAA